MNYDINKMPSLWAHFMLVNPARICCTICGYQRNKLVVSRLSSTKRDTEGISTYNDEFASIMLRIPIDRPLISELV